MVRILCRGKWLGKNNQKTWMLHPVLDLLTSSVALTKASSPRSKLQFPHL